MVVVKNKNLSRFENPIKKNVPLCDRIGQLKNTRYVWLDYYHVSFKSMGHFLKKLRCNALFESEMERFKLNSINENQFGTNKAK